MLVIRLVLLLVLIVALVVILVPNVNQTVDLKFFGREYLDTSLLYVVAGCYGLGFLTSLLVMVMREWRHRREISRLKRRQRNLDRELADLRSLPLQELSSETMAKGD